MNNLEKLQEATILALQGKLVKEDKDRELDEYKTYAIVDNEGKVYAHDIQGKIAADLTLADIISSLEDHLSKDEIDDLEIEIIEQDITTESKKINKYRKNEEKQQLNMQPTTVEEFQELVCKLTGEEHYEYITELPEGIDTSKMTTMEKMFAFCTNLKSIPKLNTSNVEDMNHMFFKCINLETIPQLDTSNVIDMSNMFNGCDNLETIPQLDTSKVRNMFWMFFNCEKLKSIPKLNTSKVTNMSGMFAGCANLTTVPQLDTSNVRNMKWMFDNWDNLSEESKKNVEKMQQNSKSFKLNV